MKNYITTNSATQECFGFENIPIEGVIKLLGGETVIAVDTETQGLSHVDDQLLMIQISTQTANFVIDVQTTTIFGLHSIFKSMEVKKVFHNASFDLKFLMSNGLPTENVYDTMLTEQVIYLGEEIKYTLKDTLQRYFSIEADKTVRNTFIGHSGDFTKEQIIYGADDTKHLLEIMKLQKAEIKRLDLTAVMELENQAVLAFVDCTYNGIDLDKPEWLGLTINSQAELEEEKAELDAMLVAEFDVPTDLFGKPEHNWASPKQVLAIFQQIDRELESVGAPVLKLVRHKHPIIKKYIKYKETSKKVSSYGEKFLTKPNNVHSDGKIHTNFRQMVSTGRVSSSSPNLQQIPQGGGFRECFKPKEGHMVVSADYSSQELAVIAYGAQEQVWLEAIRNGDDLHAISATKVFGEEFSSKEVDTPEYNKMRNATKAITFLLVYGGGSFTLANRLEISEDDAEDLMEKYFIAYPRLKIYLDNLGSYGVETGLTRSYKPFRRRRVFPTWDGDNTSRRELGRIDRQSRNFPIQSTSADMTKVAMIYVRKAIKEKKYDAKLLMPIHDELVTSCNKDIADEWSKELKSCMERAADVILEPGLLKADPQISETWVK